MGHSLLHRCAMLALTVFSLKQGARRHQPPPLEEMPARVVLGATTELEPRLAATENRGNETPFMYPECPGLPAHVLHSGHVQGDAGRPAQTVGAARPGCATS